MTTLTEERPLAISNEDKRRYLEDGAVCLRGVISPEWIEILRDATEEALENPMDMAKKGDTGQFRGDLNAWAKYPGFRRFVLEGPSWQIAQTLMGVSSVRLFADQLFVKEPGTNTPSPWHQDQPYWPVLGEHVCSVWVTMDTVTRESSGLEYIKGSHRWNRRFNPADFGEMSMKEFTWLDTQEVIPDIDANRDQYEFLSWDMEPGDCLVHHSLAVHGAGGNFHNTRRRRAISTRWFGDEAYFRPDRFFSEEMIGLKAGDQLRGPMFPDVPLDPTKPAPTGIWELPDFN